MTDLELAKWACSGAHYKALVHEVEIVIAQARREGSAEFRSLVREMREAQKEYFRHRDREVLIRSKQLEKQVDAFFQEEPA